MIIKSYEVQKNKSNFSKYNFFLLYGENLGLKKDIRKFAIAAIEQKKDDNVEMLSLYEEEILNNEENFYNYVYAGSLFNNKKIITIHEATDKIIKKISDIYDKYPENVFLIIFSEILEYKINLNTKIVANDYLTNDELLNHNFASSLSYKVQEQFSETIKSENKSIDDLINKTYQDLLIKLTESIAN